MFRTVPLPIIRSSLTVHLALVYVIGLQSAYEQGRPAGRPAGPARKLASYPKTYTSAKCTVNELLMMGRGTAQNMQRFIF